MRHLTAVLILAVTVLQAYARPQFISFQDGKLGVNFGGYHAGIGIGGLLANGTRGGIFAEAGTPTGQYATAGFGGAAAQNGQPTGGFFAGATAGPNYQASVGLASPTGNTPGSGFAQAQAGNFIASSLMGAQTSIRPQLPALKTEINADSINEVQPLESEQVEIIKTVIKEDAPPVVVKEAYEEPLPQAQAQILEKEVIHTHYKPRRAHFRKTAFLGGYVGGNGEIVGPAQNTVANVEPIAEKRVGVEAHAEAGADVNVNGGARNVYTKEVTVQRNPTFFRDIFDIPISTLKAVGNLLGNTATRTNVSVQKSVQTEAEGKHDPSFSSSSTHVSVETPNASSFFDDIFSIPINTLGAVNRFLENNVGRKSVQVVHEEGTQSRVRRVPHGRRRSNKKVIIEERSQ